MKILLLCFLILIVQSYAATLTPYLNFPAPTVITRGKVFGGYLYVSTKDGIIYKIVDDTPEVFLDLTEEVSNPEGGFTGLLNFAFPPFYNQFNSIFLWYGATTEEVGSTVATVIAVRPLEDPEDEVIELFRVENPTDRHVGGFLDFGLDGNLLVGFGDGSNAVPSGSSQDLEDDHGKILRYKVHKNKLENCYNNPISNACDEILSIPGTNPFSDSPVYALGLRQPYACNVIDNSPSNQPLLFCYENGKDSWEELNLVEKGANLGWPCQEGFEVTDFEPCDFPLLNQQTPILVYPHHSPSGDTEPWNKVGNSISPGFIYKGADSDFEDALIFGDLSGHVWVARSDPELRWRSRDWIFGEIVITGEEQVPGVLISIFEGVDGEPLVNTISFIDGATYIFKMDLDE